MCIFTSVYINTYVYTFVSYISLISLAMLTDLVILLSPSKLAPSRLKHLHPRWDILDCWWSMKSLTQIFRSQQVWFIGNSFHHSIYASPFSMSPREWGMSPIYDLMNHGSSPFQPEKNDLQMRTRQALKTYHHISKIGCWREICLQAMRFEKVAIRFWEQNQESLFCLKTNCFTFAWQWIWWGNHSLWGNLHAETAIWKRMSMKKKKVPQKHETSWCYHSIILFKPLRTKEAYNRCSHDTFW